MVVTHVPFREPLGDKKKDSRKQVWKDGSQTMWAVTPDPMKGKAWSRAGGAHSHSASTLVGQIYLPLRSEASLAETKNQLSKGLEHKGSTYTVSKPHLGARARFGDVEADGGLPEKGKDGGRKEPDARLQDHIIITVILSPSNSAS